MEIKIETYGTTGVGRVIVFEKNEWVGVIHFGPYDPFETEVEATQAANAVIETYNKIQSSKTTKA